MPTSVPVIDLEPWFGGGRHDRAGVAAQVDEALQRIGFFLVTGHGVAPELRARVRAHARAFFALPAGVKQRYAVTVGGRGWLPPGVEANGYAEGTETPPDLKESFAVGADQQTGDPEVDGYWFQPNRYPAEIPGLEPAVITYLARMRELSDELLVLCAASLGLDRDFFTRYTGHATHTMNINWYPPMDVAGVPEPGSTGSGRTPTSARLPSWTASPGRAAFRCGPRMTAGRTRRSCRGRSPSIPVTCWPGGAAAGGSPTGTGCCRPRPRRRTRTWSRWSTSTRPTTTR